MAFSPKFITTNSITSALTKIERARGFLDAAKLSEDWVTEMRSRAFVREAHHTTHIEGTQLTVEESARVLAGLAVPGADPNDTRELLNYKGAFNFVSEYLESGGPITEGLIREIHKRLVHGVRGNAADPGKYRTIQNFVASSKTGGIVYTPPPPHDVPLLMRDLVTWLNRDTDIHPVIAAGLTHFQLVHIHPFVDGNGRTSRLLSTLCLYRTGYDFKRLFTISEYYDRDRPAYYEAIQSVRENQMDHTRWVEYFIEGLSTQLYEVRDKAERLIRRDILAQQFDLSSRQRRVLGMALEKGQITTRDYAAMVKRVSLRTLQRELKEMVQKGLFVSEGATNRQIYRLSDTKKLTTNLRHNSRQNS